MLFIWVACNLGSSILIAVYYYILWIHAAINGHLVSNWRLLWRALLWRFSYISTGKQTYVGESRICAWVIGYVKCNSNGDYQSSHPHRTSWFSHQQRMWILVAPFFTNTWYSHSHFSHLSKCITLQFCIFLMTNDHKPSHMHLGHLHNPFCKISHFPSFLRVVYLFIVVLQELLFILLMNPLSNICSGVLGSQHSRGRGRWPFCICQFPWC